MTVADVFLKFRYEERDIANALRLRMGARAHQLATFAVVCLVALGASYAVASPSARRTLVWVTALVVGLASALVMGLLVVMPKVILRRRQDLRGPMTIDASDENLTVTAGGRCETIPWSDFEHVESDARIRALYHGSDVLLVPRRVFRDAERDRAFEELLGRFIRERT